MTDDIAETLAPKSDQLDAIELVNGDLLATITRVDVRKGADQPVSVHLAEFPRVWRPSKTQRRLLAHPKIWNTTKGAEWVGNKVLLSYDPTIRYGGKPVGGIVVKAASGLSGAVKVTLPDSQQTVREWTVQPLTDASAPIPSPRDQLWARIKAANITDAKGFVVNAVGHDLEAANDLTDAEAAEVLANFDALLRDWMGAER